MMYNKLVRDCFFSPRHAGRMEPNDRTVILKSNQGWQSSIEFGLQCTSSGQIERACFKANGSPYVIASLEWLCRQLEGEAVANPPEIDYQRIVNELEISPAHYPTALNAAGIYQEALFLMKKNISKR